MYNYIISLYFNIYYMKYIRTYLENNNYRETNYKRALDNYTKIKSKIKDVIIDNDMVMYNNKPVLLDEYGNIFIQMSSNLHKGIGRINMNDETELSGIVKDKEEIYDYIISLHGNEEDNDIYDRLKSNYYILQEIDINDIDSPYQIDYDKVDEYFDIINKTKKYPPIVIDKNNIIVDGGHRYEAILLTKQNKINVWKPCSKKVYDKNKLSK